MTAKKQPSWYRYERKKAKAFRATHVGGPGREDARKGRQKIEIKDRKRPITRPELIKLRRKGVVKVITKSGFTKPALEYGRERRMKLYKRRKKLT